MPWSPSWRWTSWSIQKSCWMSSRSLEGLEKDCRRAWRGEHSTRKTGWAQELHSSTNPWVHLSILTQLLQLIFQAFTEIIFYHWGWTETIIPNQIKASAFWANLCVVTWVFISVFAVVRLVGSGCLSWLSAASGGPFKSWIGVASHELQR